MATPYRSFLKCGYTHYPIMDDPFVFLTKKYNPHKSQLYKQSECFPSLPQKEPKKTTPKSVKRETDVARQEVFILQSTHMSVSVHLFFLVCTDLSKICSKSSSSNPLYFPSFHPEAWSSNLHQGLFGFLSLATDSSTL